MIRMTEQNTAGVTAYECFEPDAGIPIVRFVYPRFTGSWPAMRRKEAEIYSDFLGHLFTDTELYENMAQENYTMALERLTTDIVRDPLLDVYAKVSGQNSIVKTV